MTEIAITRHKAILWGVILFIVWLSLPFVFNILPSEWHFNPFSPELVVSEVFTLAVALLAVGSVLDELEKTRKSKSK